MSVHIGYMQQFVFACTIWWIAPHARKHTHTHTRERRFCCCMCKILIPLCFNKVSVTVTVTVKIIYADWNYSSTKVKWKDPQRVAGTSCGFVGVLAGSQLCLFAGFLFGVPGFSPKRISFDLLVWCSYTYKSYLLFLVNMILPLKPFPWWMLIYFWKTLKCVVSMNCHKSYLLLLVNICLPQQQFPHQRCSAFEKYLSVMNKPVKDLPSFLAALCCC